MIEAKVENIVRNKKDFPNLENDFKVKFKIESLESIHPYNVYSELKTTIGALKQKLKK